DEFVDSIMDSVVAVGTAVGNSLDSDGVVAGPIQKWEVPAGGILVCAVIIIILTVLLLLSVFVIGLALAARNMLLYVMIVAAPICLSGLSWEPTRRWAGKWSGWVTALIFAKLAIVVVFGLGVLAVKTPIPVGEGMSAVLPYIMTVLSGTLMLILAAFMPVACFWLFGFLGEQGVKELQAAASGAQAKLESAPNKALAKGQTAA